MAFLIPAIFVFVFGWAILHKTDIYQSFTAGVGDAVQFILQLAPCLVSIFILCQLFEVSGLSHLLQRLLCPLLEFLQIPEELAPLLLIKPFSGSGSLAYLQELMQFHGADSYIARCGAVCFGSSETVFYVSAIYFAGVKQKKLAIPILIVLIATFISTIVACLLCKVI